jgi:hypothetical protein
MSNGDDESALADFVTMSAALTGFTADALRPGIDPGGLARIYLDTVIEEAGAAAYSALHALYIASAGNPPQQIADALLETSSGEPASKTAQLAQSIVQMWYLGSWYAPALPVCPPSAASPVRVISSEAYKSGLAWKLLQTHPMGYSEFSFGYWSTEPPPLSEFGVDDTASAGGGNHE